MTKQLLFLFCMLFARALLAQEEELPFFVDPPKVSITAITTWQEITLTYTLHWLDGYRPQFDDAKPENMSFSPFELDPARGYKLEKQNQHKYKNENYVDLVYHLRLLNEKKGETPIPEQVFKYIKEGPGGSVENSEVKDFKVPVIPAIGPRYDSLLTKGADDIMDNIDFGSFKKQEQTWKGLAIIPLVLFGISTLILFRRRKVLVSRKKVKMSGKTLKQTGENYQERHSPKEALKLFNKNLGQLLTNTLLVPNPAPPLELLTKLHEELRQLLVSYVPGVLDSDTPRQIGSKIAKIESGDLRDNLRVLNDCLVGYDDLLYAERPPVTYVSLSIWIMGVKESARHLEHRGKIRKLLERLAFKCRNGSGRLYENIKTRLRRTQ